MFRNAILILVLSTLSYAAGANVYIQHNLVSDIPGLADVTDPNLINPWGISYGATGPFWVSNQGKGNSTLYNGSGTITPLVAVVPAASGSQPGKPTGQVVNTTTGFVIPAVNRPAGFIFATEDGTISAWANGIAGNVAAIMINNAASGAVYDGLAISPAANGPLLYAANLKTGAIDVFDANWNPATVPGGFADPNVPAGYAPFNIWALNGKLYVMYAQQNAAKNNVVPGTGNGQVAVFDFNGNLQKHLTSGSTLNAPWGVALAPSTFGAFGGALLVGNFGDGKINAFDANTGAALGTLQDAGGKPIVLEGLWALIFGNGGNGGDKNTLYFAAGINGEKDGLLGSLAPPASVLSVVNGASQQSGPISPGEVVVLSGITIGPSPLVSAAIPAAGTVGSSLGGVSVTFNGAPAPVLYTSASQTSVVAPYGLGGFTSADVVVSYRGQTATTKVPVALSAPGIFTIDFSGTGPAVALNADGTLNSSTLPATAGSVITLFATGAGPENPPGEDGVVNDRILRTPQLQVSLTIGAQTAKVLYAGSGLGLIQGVMQIQAVIPSGVTGTVPVVLTVGGASSQPNATIAVK